MKGQGRRVIIRVTPFRALITLLVTYLLSPLPLQVGVLLWVERLAIPKKSETANPETLNSKPQTLNPKSLNHRRLFRGACK